MAAQAKALIFDHTTLLNQDNSITDGLREVQNKLKKLGVLTVVFSTHAIRNFGQRIASCGYPPVDLLLTRADVGASKGSPDWLTTASQRLGIPVHRFFYLGDDEQDWRTAINSGILYLHARWVKPLPDRVTAFTTGNPQKFYKFLTHFFLPPPRWEYSLNDDGRRLYVRSLLNSSTRLMCDAPFRSFDLKDIFTYDNQRKVGGTKARDLLMMHAVANLCAEGTICSGCRFAVYPSSTPGNPNPTFNEFLGPAAKFFHGWLKENMLYRAVQAIDSSMARAQSQQVPFTNQTNTVHLHQDYVGSRHLVGKKVIVFDDFTTSGMSLDWARSLLYSGGAERVILVTFGKFGQNHPLRHNFYEPHQLKPVRPFELNNYAIHEFTWTALPMTRDNSARSVTQTMFTHWSRGEPYPVSTL
jgi:hypothetical protein